MEIKKFLRRLIEWRRDPVRFVEQNFKVEPDVWQIQALRAFGDQNQPKLRIALQACVGPGKTAALAWMAWNFLACYGETGNHPKGAAVSITGDNLKDNLWPELSKWQKLSPFLSASFLWTKERVFNKDHPETWFLSARSYSKTANADEQGRTLSGLHSKYILGLIDESGEIPPAVGRAAEQAMSERDCKFGRIVQAGNPSSHEGLLYAAASTLAHLWRVIRITGDPEDPNRSPRIDLDWAKEQIATYGRENPWVMSSILGLFPPQSMNSLLGPDEVQAAMDRHLRPDDYNWSQKRIGVDVARFGDDRTVLFPRQGLAAFMPVIMRQVRTTDIAARVAVAKKNWGSEMEFIDDSGHWGHGVIDNLITAGYQPQAVLFEGKNCEKQYLNKRAEMWFKMAEWVKRGGALPQIPELVRELTAPTYTFHNGKIMLEPKDLIKKRIGVSPDLADALALTFALPDMPRTDATTAMLMGKREAATSVSEDWNPYADK